MFPLGGVLFPFAFLPLHVFEPRYRVLTYECLAGDREFGVVLIDRGSEVGGGDHRTDVGTVAKIIRAEQSDDGRWGLLCVGDRRIDVVRWLDDDPYPKAEVRERDEAPWSDGADAVLGRAERAVRRSLGLRAELDEPAPPIDVDLADEPVAASWQLASISPLGAFDRQRVLAIDDPADRLAVLADLTEDACAVLAQRLSGL
jgi:Lon protease-like protein